MTNHSYYITHKEEIKARNKLWAKLHPEKFKEREKIRHHKYYITHKDEWKNYVLKYRREHPEKIKERQHRYYVGHREEFKIYGIKYRTEHVGKIKEKNHKYYIIYRKEILLQQHIYQIEHREQRRLSALRWRQNNRERYRKHRKEYRNRPEVKARESNRSKIHIMELHLGNPEAYMHNTRLSNLFTEAQIKEYIRLQKHRYYKRTYGITVFSIKHKLVNLPHEYQYEYELKNTVINKNTFFYVLNKKVEKTDKFLETLELKPKDRFIKAKFNTKCIICAKRIAQNSDIKRYKQYWVHSSCKEQMFNSLVS